MTPTHQKMFEFVKAHQPVTKDDVVAAGFNPKTAGNFLASRILKRCAIGVDGLARVRLHYWLDDEYKPHKAPKLVVDPITHHPIMQALYGGLNAHW